MQLNAKQILSVLPLLIGWAAFGQSPYFQNYFLLRKSDPLQIQTIYQGRSGYLWIGTDKGLFQFDGVTTNHFTVKDSLAENSITALAQDSVGRIWIGHPSGKISIRFRGRFTKFNPPEGNAIGEISDILFDKAGNLWFSTFNDGLYYFVNDRLYRLDQEDGMPDIFIYDLELDAEGNIVAGTDGGIAICRLEDRKVKIATINYSNGLPDNIIKKVNLAADGTLWLATEDAGVVQYNPKTKKVIKLDDQWSDGAIQDMTSDGDQLWVANARGDLIVYNEGRRVAMYKAPVSSVSSLMCDQEGNIWVGSKTGLSRTLGNFVEYIERFDPYSNANVAALTVDGAGTVWYATSEGLFTRSAEKEVRKFTLPSAYSKSSIISLFTDSHGFIWAGTYGEGVMRINPKNKSIATFRKELINGSALNISGRDGEVWLSTLGGGTRIKIDEPKLEIENFGSKQGLSSDYVYQIFVDSRKRVWFATDRAGIDCLEGSEIRHYKEQFASKAVYAITEDADHRIWANVQGDGLVLVDGEPLSGLPLNWKELVANPLIVTSDQDGNLLIVNERGIMSLNVKSKKIRLLGDEAGFRERVANLNAVAQEPSGKIWIGTEDGMAIYNGVNADAAGAPVPRVTGLRAFEEEIEIRDAVKLSYDQNNLTFLFTAFWYQNPEGLNFEYQLENYDREWIPTGDRLVVYSSLPPGNYTFKVRASNQTVFTNAQEATLALMIRPPFWRTNLFYVVAVLLVGLLGYTYIKSRESRLQREKIVLERRVQERTMEIQKKNEEIQAQSEEIKSINDNLEKMVQARTSELEKKNRALEEYAFINAHNLRSPVASILGLINLLCKIETDEKGKEIVQHMQQSADRLESVVKSITEAIERGDTPIAIRNVKEREQEEAEE